MYNLTVQWQFRLSSSSLKTLTFREALEYGTVTTAITECSVCTVNVQGVCVYLQTSRLLDDLDQVNGIAEFVFDRGHALFLCGCNLLHLRAQCCVFGLDGLQVLQHHRWVLLQAQCQTLDCTHLMLMHLPSVASWPFHNLYCYLVCIVLDILQDKIICLSAGL